MSIAETEAAGIDPQVLADLEAVMKRIIDGTPVDLETSRRIEEGADRVTEEVGRTRGSWTTTGSMGCFTTTMYEVRARRLRCALLGQPPPAHAESRPAA